MSDIHEALNLLSEVVAQAALKHQKEKSELYEEIYRLKSELETALNGVVHSADLIKYHGCYNITDRKTPIRTGSEVVIILGGPQVIAEALGCDPAVISKWRDYLPKRYRDQITAMMKERGFNINRRLWA